MQEIYDVPQWELDLLMAETAEMSCPQIAKHFTDEINHFLDMLRLSRQEPIEGSTPGHSA